MFNRTYLSTPAPVVLAAYGERDAKFLKELRENPTWPGYYVRLRK